MEANGPPAAHWLAPPPIHVTGNTIFDWLIIAVVYFVLVRIALYWFKAAHLARESIIRFAENLAWAAITWVFVLALVQNSRPYNPSLKLLPLIAALVVFFVRASTARSRHIPRAVRRAVIERDLKGEPFDPTKHHIDHIWPFAFGGSHTLDNLRVVPKADNQRKGRKRPRWHEMFWE